VLSKLLFKLTYLSLLRDLDLLEALGLSVGNVARTLHEATDLSWHFFENLFSQVAPGNSCVELDELDNVSGNGLAHRVPKGAIVAIELLHG